MRLGKALKILCCTLAALYILGGILLFFFQRSLVFPGQHMSRDHKTYKLRKTCERTFDINGEKIQGWLLNRPRTPLIVYFGGNGEDAAWGVRNFLADNNYSYLAANYRGYGLSTGSPSEKDLIQDGVTLIETVLQETNRSHDQVIIIGQSLGSGVATGVAAKLPPVGKLVLIIPFDNLYSIAAEQMPFYPVSLLIRDKFPSDERMKSLKCPVSIISAEKDTVIPVRHARRLAKMTPSLMNYTELPGVGHNDLKSSPHFDAVYRKELQLPQLPAPKPVVHVETPPPVKTKPAAGKQSAPAKRHTQERRPRTRPAKQSS